MATGLEADDRASLKGSIKGGQSQKRCRSPKQRAIRHKSQTEQAKHRRQRPSLLWQIFRKDGFPAVRAEIWRGCSSAFRI